MTQAELNKQYVKDMKVNIEKYITAQVTEFEKATGATVDTIRVEAQKILTSSGEEVSYNLRYDYKISL